MPSWVCQWKPFWIPGRRFVQKGLLWRSGSSSPVNLLTDRTLWISLCSTAQTTLIAYLKHPDHRDNSILFLGSPRGPQDKAYFLERIEAPLPPLRSRPKCNFIHPRQLSPFPERLELPFSNDEILCCFEEIDSSGTGSIYCEGQGERTRNPCTAYG